VNNYYFSVISYYPSVSQFLLVAYLLGLRSSCRPRSKWISNYLINMRVVISCTEMENPVRNNGKAYQGKIIYFQSGHGGYCISTIATLGTIHLNIIPQKNPASISAGLRRNLLSVHMQGIKREIRVLNGKSRSEIKWRRSAL